MAKKLKVEDIPDGFSYAAVDADGFAFAYKSQPYFDKKNEVWKSPYSEDSIRMIAGGFDASDYQNSLVSREPEQKPKLKKLTAADIPDGFNFAAVDSDGAAYAYIEKPRALNSFWNWPYNSERVYIGRYNTTDWANSLVSRENIETEPAYKEKTNKLSYSEIDPYFLEQMARRMNEGKKKYGPNNWKKLSDINELLDAAQRHLLELRKMMEQDFEPIPGQETDLQHCAALACNAMFIHYHLNPNT